MNISFVTKSSTSTNRHMLEHLMLYRSKNFPEATSFYKYLYKNNVIIDFKTLYDYMEVSFYNVSLEIIKDIENIFQNFYFTEEDFNLEKRVILIESANYNYEKVEKEKSLLFNNYENVCDKNILENITYLDILKIKENIIFEKFIYEDFVNRDSGKIDIKKTVNQIKKIKEKIIKINISFLFEKNEYLFDLSDILHKCLYISKSGIILNRIFTLTENTIFFYEIQNKESLCLILKKSFLENFDGVYNLFIKENKPNGVQFNLKNYRNIKIGMTKGDVFLCIDKIIKEICK